MRSFVDYESLWGDLGKRVPFLAAAAATRHSNLPSAADESGVDRVERANPALRRIRAAATRVLRRAAVGVTRFVRSWEQNRRARANYEVLSRLDEQTLRDLGLTRSEVGSAAAELGGRATATRRRIEAEFWQSASAGFRVRKVEMFLSVAVFAAFAAVVAAALKAPEVLVAWRATVVFV